MQQLNLLQPRATLVINLAVTKKQRELFFNASDIFNTLKIKKELYENGFKLTSTGNYETQVLRLGYSYKF